MKAIKTKLRYEYLEPDADAKVENRKAKLRCTVFRSIFVNGNWIEEAEPVEDKLFIQDRETRMAQLLAAKIEIQSNMREQIEQIKAQGKAALEQVQAELGDELVVNTQ